MFLYEQAVLTNNLLTSISDSLTMIVNHLTGNTEIGQCNTIVKEATDLAKPHSGEMIAEINDFCGYICKKYYIPCEKLIEIKEKSTFRKNFCVRLVRLLFKKKEIKILQVLKMEEKMGAVFSYYYTMYPDRES